MSRRLRIGTRGSALALWQAHWVRDTIARTYPEVDIEIIEVTSHGDRDVTTDLTQLGTVGIFTQTLERRLLDEEIDLAVHSLKDVPAQLLSDDLELVAFSPREDPRDVWFHKAGLTLAQAGENADTTVATGSLRRRSQLLNRVPNVKVVPLRGNLNTRMEKFKRGDFDAMILAAAGVKRLGWSDLVTEWIGVDTMLPAVAQGVLGLETRKNDGAGELALACHDPSLAPCVWAERSLLTAVAGGCVVPLAGHCVWERGERLWLRARLGRPDGSKVLAAEARGTDPQELGRQVAHELLDQGGADIVRAAKEGEL